MVCKRRISLADSLLTKSLDDITAFSFAKAYKDASNALSIYQEYGNKKGIANCYISLARTYEEMELWQDAIECLKKAGNIVPQLSPKAKYIYYYAMVDFFVEHKKNYDMGEKMLKLSIENDKSINDSIYVYTDLSNLSEIYINQGKYAKASTILEQLEQFPNKFFSTQVSYCRMLMAKRLGLTDSTYIYAEECLKKSERFKQLNLQLSSLETLKDIDSIRNDNNKFIRHYIEYSTLKDSLNGGTSTSRINQIKEKFTIDQERLLMSSKAKSQRMLLILIVIVAASITIILFLFYFRAKEKKKIAELEATQLSDKLKRKELEKELADLRVSQEKAKLEKSQKENITMSLQLAMIDDKSKLKRMKMLDEQISIVDIDFCNKLEKKFPSISRSEERLACLIRKGLDSNEILNVLGISSSGLYKLRYRLRKRLNIVDKNLDKYIMHLEDSYQ